MSTKEQSVTLLRRNKREQAAAFNAVGLTHVNQDSRASEFGKYIKWAGGLLDLCIAVQHLENETYHYFTREEWDSLTNVNKEKFVKRGLRVRAYGHSFILAPGDCFDSAGSTLVAWANRKDVAGLANRTCGDAYNDFAGKENTNLIIEALSGAAGPQNVNGAPAAEVAASYKAYTKEYDGLDDESDWHLPGLGVLITIYKCKTEIQEALEYFWSSESRFAESESNTAYWSSTECDASTAFCSSIHTSVINPTNKETTARVRAVCEEV